MSNAESLHVLGNKDLLGYILQFIVRPKHYADEITDWLPLYTLSSLSRACRRTRQLLSSHSDLQCARRVYDEAHICAHQPVHPSDPCDMCFKVPFECNAGMGVYAPDRRGGYAGSNVKAPLRMKCVCKCHNYQCPYCIGALKAGFVCTSVEGWTVGQGSCSAFQRHQYAFFVEGNFVVSSYFLGRFSRRTGVDIAQTCCPSWDVFARGHGPFHVIPQMRMFSRMFDDEGYWIAAALLSGDAALLTYMVSGDEDGDVTSEGLVLYLKMIGRIRPGKEDIHPGRIWNIEKRGHVHHKQTAPWPYPLAMTTRCKSACLNNLLGWEVKIREKLVRTERVKAQLAVLNTLVCANPALRKRIWTRNASISIMCGDPTLSAECKVEVIVKTCILKYGWFNPQVIVNYTATKIVDEQLSSRDIPFDAMLNALGDKVVYTNQIEQALIYLDGAENLCRPPRPWRTGSLYE